MNGVAEIYSGVFLWFTGFGGLMSGDGGIVASSLFWFMLLSGAVLIARGVGRV